MVYIKGSSNVAADALSCHPDHGVSEIEEMPPVFPDIVEVNSVICFAIGDKECVDALKECHDSPWAGHPGPEKTFSLLSRKYWWPTMEEDVHKYVHGCHSCQRNKPDHTG